MSAFIPVSAKLRSSFLRPLEFTTALPANLPDETSVSEEDIRLHTHVARASCSEQEWLGLRSMSAEENKKAEVLSSYGFPLGKELNYDRLAFCTYETAGKYCALRVSDFRHIYGPRIVQGRSCFIVPGTVSRTDKKIAPPGVLVMRTWPGYYRLVAHTFTLPLQGEGASGRSGGGRGCSMPGPAPGHRLIAVEDQEVGADDPATRPAARSFTLKREGEGVAMKDTAVAPAAAPACADAVRAGGAAATVDATLEEKDCAAVAVDTVATIEIHEDKKLARGNWPAANFSFEGMDLKPPHLGWNACIAQWNRTGPKGAGEATFWFPIAVFGPSFKPQKVMGAANLFPAEI